MKGFAYRVWVLVVGLLTVGCSVKPGNLQVTARDQEMYNDAGGGPLVQNKEAKYPVAILVSSGKDDREKAVYAALDAAVSDNLSKIAFFSVVERSNLGALAKEQNLESLNDADLAKLDIPKADYLITAKITSATMAKAPLSNLSYQGKVQVDYRFYEKAGNRVIVTKNIEGASSSYVRVEKNQDPAPVMAGPAATAKLVEAAQETAKAFAVELGKRYAPAARVVETRGEGQVARITIGSNYGVAAKSKVEFYEFADNSAIVAGATREPRVIGYGTVVEVADGSAWAEVQDHKKVKVLRGHYARLASDQSKTAGEKLGDGLGAMFK